MPIRHSFDMTIGRGEFLRLLPGAVGTFDTRGDVLQGTSADRGWVIRLTPLAPGSLGGVAVPRHRVEITLEEHSEAEAEAFMERFHRGFLRGGG